MSTNNYHRLNTPSSPWSSPLSFFQSKNPSLKPHLWIKASNLLFYFPGDAALPQRHSSLKNSQFFSPRFFYPTPSSSSSPPLVLPSTTRVTSTAHSTVALGFGIEVPQQQGIEAGDPCPFSLFVSPPMLTATSHSITTTNDLYSLALKKIDCKCWRRAYLSKLTKIWI